MKKMVLLIAVLSVLGGLFAQWSNDASTPNAIAAYNGEQVLPKVGITSEGYTYVARFDTAYGGYRVYLQCFSPSGEMIWDNPEGYW